MNIVVITQGKFVYIDSILPLLMEICDRYNGVEVTFIVPRKEKAETIKNNYHIYKIFQKYSFKIKVLNKKNIPIASFNILTLFFKAMTKKGWNVIFRPGSLDDVYVKIIKIMKRISKTVVIRSHALKPFPRETTKLHKIYWAFDAQIKKEEGKEMDKEYDVLIKVLNDNVIIHEKGGGAVIYFGYSMKLNKWPEYLDKESSEYSSINDGRYFLFILTTLGYRRFTMNEPKIIELLEETLEILKRYNSEIKTIFRPHPKNTDVDKFKELLDKIGYQNYVIDYGHPAVLSSKAEFVIGNLYSMTMYDAYYLGKPIIEYCQYDPELYEKIGRQSFGTVCCDFHIYRDEQKLQQVLDKLIRGEVEVKRDKKILDQIFRDTPEETWRFFDSLAQK